MAKGGLRYLKPPCGRSEDPVTNCRSVALSCGAKSSTILQNHSNVGQSILLHSTCEWAFMSSKLSSLVPQQRSSCWQKEHPGIKSIFSVMRRALYPNSLIPTLACTEVPNELGQNPKHLPQPLHCPEHINPQNPELTTLSSCMVNISSKLLGMISVRPAERHTRIECSCYGVFFQYLS